MTDLTHDESSQRPGTIEQIRDLIFGPQKRLIDERLDRLASELQRVRDEAQRDTLQLRESLQTDASSNKQTMELRVQQLSGKLFEETSRLLQGAEQYERKLTADVAGASRAMSEAIASLRQEMADMQTAHQSEFHQLRERITADVEAKAAALRDDKVSRLAMADLLQELAMKLKGVDVLAELGEAVRTNSGD